jgi:hypothetical protein
VLGEFLLLPRLVYPSVGSRRGDWALMVGARQLAGTSAAVLAVLLPREVGDCRVRAPDRSTALSFEDSPRADRLPAALPPWWVPSS